MSCTHCVKGKVKVDRRIMGVAIEVEVDCDVCKGTGLNQDSVPQCSDESTDFSKVDWGYTNVVGGECCWEPMEPSYSLNADGTVMLSDGSRVSGWDWLRLRPREDTWSDEAVKREVDQLRQYYAHPTVTWDWAAGYYDWRKGAKS